MYHLISRFVDREWFISNEPERRQYLTLLGRAVGPSDWRCLAYAVMSNHIHLAVVAGEEKLDSWIRRAHAPFADWMNKKYDRIGNVFVRGPKAIPIPNDRAGHLLAYLHNNPVRAKLVPHPADSMWTSHRFYADLEPAPSWLDMSYGRERAGIGSASDFNDWVAAGPAHPLHTSATPDESYEDIIANYEEQQVALLRAAHREAPATVPRELLASVADVLGIHLSQLRSQRRGAVEVLGRAVVVRCCVALGYTGTQIARALGVSDTAVSKIRKQSALPAVVAISDQVLARLGTAELSTQVW